VSCKLEIGKRFMPGISEEQPPKPWRSFTRKTATPGFNGKSSNRTEKLICYRNSDVTGSQQYPNGADSPQRIPNHHHHHDGAEVYR
jgi:hypothetical protein